MRINIRSILGLTSLTLLLSCSEPNNTQSQTNSPVQTPAMSALERGEYLTTAGNCVACHTRPGGKPFAGGRAIPTPFGNIYSSNLSSDPTYGLGSWNSDEFWNAIHLGKSKNGESLYPAFPYTSYSQLTREDSDAIFEYLQTLESVPYQTPSHQLRFPYNTQWALDIWRLLFFKPEPFTANKDKSDTWNSGAYLVMGLGHCDACHSPRGALGNKTGQALSGGYLTGLDWDASPLTRGHLTTQERSELVQLLSAGVNQRSTLSGPMAEVTRHSLQYLKKQDLQNMVEYLSSLPAVEPTLRPSISVSKNTASKLIKQGESIYNDHCSDCHGEEGKGTPYKYPALSGNANLNRVSPTNAINQLLDGGFGASTQGHPQPYGMPPFAHQLDDIESAAVLSYIRNAWGNSAPAVSPQALRD